MMNLKRSTVFFALLLISCAHASQQSAGQAEKPGLEAKKQAELPKQELTEEMLYEYLLGDMALQRGQPELATQLYLKLANSTRDPRLARYAAHLAFETRQMDKAMSAFNLWLEIEPDSLLAKQALATLLVSGGKLDEARPHLVSLLAAATEGVGNIFTQISSMIASYPDKNAAFNLLRELAQPYPRVAEARWVLAQVAEAAGQHELALKEAQQAYALRPEWDSAVLLNAQLMQSAAPQKALALLKKYLETYPDTKEVRLFYARALTQQKQNREARSEFQKLLNEYPDNADLAFAVGLLSLDMGELDRGEKELQQALTNRKKDENVVYYYLGQLSEAKKHDEDAMKNYSKVRGGEYNFNARLRMAYLTNKLGKLDEARQLLHKTASKNNKERIQLTMVEAQILRDAQQFESAYQVVMLGLEKLPNQPELMYEAAMLANKIGKLDAFEQMMRKLIEIEPDNAQVYNALGYGMLERNERISEAMKLVEKAYQLDPDDAGIIDSMGLGYYRLGNMSKSVEFLRRAYAAYPDPEIAAHLGEVLWMQGEEEQAKKIWSEALKSNPDSTVLQVVIKKFTP
ncbi:tetratricopeptide repeat protein [Candidatus Nitrotoga sp. M5]|uniref:tetratricopeptide repeat protein n=1 Tax=Candidatus Nitrotoga sp. M5 TaxID=2890409 RepID=UPI001EF3C156|nr:tetratricopeptide repeat protein [Candidatus Nitrotoga sp. M5]CAH1385529.1 Tetratricopeptide repeat-containing protein [Candidatus Nitrotoga sp. M5]